MRRLLWLWVVATVCLIQALASFAAAASWAPRAPRFPPRPSTLVDTAGLSAPQSLPSSGALVASILVSDGTVVGYGLYCLCTHTLNTAPLNATFSASVVGGSAPYQYVWDFGDGSPSALSSRTWHMFRLPGYYILHLVVTDAVGDLSVAWAGISIYPSSDQTYSVLAAAGPEVGAAPLQMHYGINGYGGLQGPTVTMQALDFDFGDGTPDATWTAPANGTFYWGNPTHTYTSPGEYLLTLNATESVNGGTVYSVSEFTVYVQGPGGIPAVDPLLGGDGVWNYSGPTLNVGFRADVVGLDSSGYTSVWTFGDGSTPAIGNPIAHDYMPPATGFATYFVGFIGVLNATTTVTSQLTPLEIPAAPGTGGFPPISLAEIELELALAGDIGLAAILIAVLVRRRLRRPPPYSNPPS